MDKEQWMESSYTLLERIFGQTADFEELEYLAESFLVAAPYLYNVPEAVFHGCQLKDFYKKKILQAEPEPILKHVRACAFLCVGLFTCRKVIWETFTPAEKGRVSAYLSACGHSNHSWEAESANAGRYGSSRGGIHLYYMLILAFLHQEGCAIHEETMRGHAMEVLSCYTGDGWYRDDSPWGRNGLWQLPLYGPLWNKWYGYDKEPYIAWKLEEHMNEWSKTIPLLFDREGNVVQWGAGHVGRYAAAALQSNLYLRRAETDFGLVRALSSQTLSTALSDPESWAQNPLSCLALPDGHPFWTAPICRGAQDGMQAEKGWEEVLDGPGMVINCYPEGFASLRTAKLLMAEDDPDLPASCRLSFNSRYPWEAWDMGGAEAMQYCLRNPEVKLPNGILYGGCNNGLLYRKLYFGYGLGTCSEASVYLADFPVANGLVRVDKVNISNKPYELTLAAYGFPVQEACSVNRRSNKEAAAVILKSAGRQLAFVAYTGFDGIEVRERRGVSRICEKSMLAFGVIKREQNTVCQPSIIISAVLQKEGEEEWAEDELFPVKRIRFADRAQCGAYGPVSLQLKDGRTMAVDYDAVDGRLMV